MANRYTTQPRGYFIADPYSGELSATADTVLLPEDERPHPTGLCDQYGTTIYRVPDRVTIGFQVKAR